MFVDQIKIQAIAGNGGDGVVRWHREKFKPFGGPAGGNGGKGGDVYVRAVRDLNVLSKYTGSKEFRAEDGVPGGKSSQHGKGSEDIYIDVPVGSEVRDLERERTYILAEEGQVEKILQGGAGGLGNEYFKSSTNRSPEQATKGKPGEEGEFDIELTLVADVGFVGLPNAGKSSLLNALTNARSTIGSYPFTTLEPHLGAFYGYLLADIPGLIAGASEGKGLGHKFLRHVSKTKMLLHLVSLDSDEAEKDYYTILKELSNYNKNLIEREHWIILTKKDLVNKEDIDNTKKVFDNINNRVFVVSINDPESVKVLSDSLVSHLRAG